MLPRFLTQPTQQVNWASPLNQGLVSWWLALPGRTGGGTWFDLCNRNHGTLAGSETWKGDAVDTSPAASGKITLPSVKLTNPFAMSVVVKISSFTAGDNPGMWRSASGVGTYFMLWNGTSGRPWIRWAGSNVLQPASGYSISTGEWLYMLWQVDSSASKFFVNGVLQHSSGGSSTVPVSDTIPWIGHHGGTSANHQTPGLYRSVRFYNRSFDDSSAMSLYMEEAAGNPQTLIRIRRPLAFDTGGGGGGGGNAGHRIIGGGWGGRVICAA